MKDEVNSVKMAGRAYHHGALREALIDAAEAIIAERGVEGFSLREAARRAGVSPAAPGHHFGDARGLLTAVATRAFRDFGDALEAGTRGEDSRERIRGQGMAYVRFALANRARFELMWRKALLDREDPDYCAAGDRAFRLLDRAARGAGAPEGPDLPGLAPSIAAWSIVHGFVELALSGAFGTGPEELKAATEQLLPRVLDHLVVG
ncbi:TetR/AcrR family transcriptional regulator [Sphingomonas sp. MS122]|uniref:TetR/AcrR family transcriptional regulator n=1 Tax=Sphingomonas sp. MS122 TaxID=3412683 RepID=UPI003C2E57D8